MPVKRGHLYIIDFNPRIKTKPGKLRPGLVLQSDLVNEADYHRLSSSQRPPGLLKIREFFGFASRRAKVEFLATAIYCWAK